MYEQGIGVEKNNENAYIFYKLAAKEKFALAELNVARCIEFGIELMRLQI